MDSIYHKLRKTNPESARLLVRKVLKNNSVSKTARILGISRNTVRRVRDDSLSDISRRSYNSLNKVNPVLNRLVIEEVKRTNYRYRLLKNYIQKKHSIVISEYTIKTILKRDNDSVNNCRKFILVFKRS
jgi:recombinational DNA repair protein RecR